MCENFLILILNLMQSPELSFPQVHQNIETIATLLDDVGVSWASYSENM